MKKNFVMFLALIATAHTAFASGVEMKLPADAHNVKIQSVELGGTLVGQKLISDGIEGPVYENIYKSSLGVTLTYESSDTTDVPAAVDGQSNGTLPTRYFELPVSDREAAAISAKQLDARSLVGDLKISLGTDQVEDPAYQYQCSYDGDTNQPLYGCVESPAPMKTVQVVIVTVDRK